MAIIRANSKEAYELAAKRAPGAAEKAKKKREEWEEKYKQTLKTTDEKTRTTQKTSATPKKTVNEKSTESYFRKADEKADRVQAGLAVRRATQALSSRGSAGIAQMADRGIDSMGALGRARSFDEYMKLRKEEEDAMGMQSAAQKLLEQAAAPEKTAEEREKEAQAAKELREKQYGYKRMGDRAVFATPFSPLPDENEWNTATKAEAPAAFGISPYEYVNKMKTISEGEPQMEQEAADFLETYFNKTSLPTAEEYDAVYERLYNDMSVPDEEVRYFWEEGQRLMQEAEGYRDEYDAAMELLGEGAKKYADGTEADFLSHYMQAKIYGQQGMQSAAETYEQEYEVPGIGQTFDEHDATMQSILNRGKENPYSGTRLETGATLLQKEMSDEQAQTYMAIAQQYGEDAAQMYYDSLLKNGFNKRAYEIRDEALREDANDGWLGATFRTFANVPGQVAGTMYSLGQGLKGEEIDPYDIAFMPSQAVQTPREEVSQMITNNYGKPDEETGEYKDTLWSWLMKAGYNAYTSGTDSMMAGLLGARGAGAAAVLQGLWQMGGGAQDATLRGGDTEKALLYGGISAAVEAATEYLPMETLTKALESQNVKTFKDILKMALAGAVSEAPGEGLSELGNAIADDLIMQEMSRWTDAKEQLGAWGAAKQLAGDVLTSAFVGAISGAGSNTLAATGTYGVNKIVDRAVEKANAAAQPVAEQTAPVQPESQQQGQTVHVEEGEGQKEKPVIGAEKGQNSGVEKNAAAATPSASGEGKAATYSADGTDSKVQVLGVASVRKDGRIMVEVQSESGEREVVNAADVVYDDATTEELMAYGASERMDAKGLQTYLDSYDESMGTAEEYAKAFSSIYSRARSGMDFERAALANNARSAMTQDAMIAAYMAGERQYMADNDVLSAKEQKFQKKMLNVLNKYAGGKIVLTNKDIGGNATYDPETGVIMVSTSAQKGAYAYYAIHELGHKLKAENAQQWTKFQELVMDALDNHGVSVSDLMQHEAEKFEMNNMAYDDDLLLEEVICNNAASILQDEEIVADLIRKDRGLMERVADFLREFIDKMNQALQRASKDMSELGSWKSMQALKDDHESLKAIYDCLMDGLEQTNNQQAEQDAQGTKMSATEVADSFKEAQKKYAGKNLANDKSLYDYDFLVALPDMQVTVMGKAEDVQKGNKVSETDVIALAKENGAAQGSVDQMGISVQNSYTGRNIRLTAKAIRHSLGRQNYNAAIANARATVKAGELLKNAVPINALHDTGSAAQGTYAMAAYMRDAQENMEHVAVLTVEQRSGDVVGMEVYDTLHALSTRKRNVVVPKNQTASTAEEQGLTSPTRPIEISISNFLEIVNETHQSLLSEDVLAHFNEERNPQGYYSGRAKYSLGEDQTNTPAFQRWFGNSQIVNEDGSPKVVYHGTASEFWSFDKKKANDLTGRRMGLGAGGGKFYLTEHKGSGNAAAYSAQQAGKGNQPNVMELYVSAQKVMDRSEYDRRLNELYAKYPNSDPRGEAYDYRQRDKAIAQLDKAIRKEGYDGVWDKESGELFVYESTQIKSATNNVGTFDPSNPDIRFSLKEPVEETRDLLAVHNLTEENMRNAMELGGLAMPSIAVIKAEQGHSLYGPISVIFDKSTIDPKASSANEIYGGDAWTPTFPKVEYEADSKAEERISNKYYELQRKYGNDAVRPLYRYANNLEEELNRNGGVSRIVDRLNDDTDMMQLYLADTGREMIKPVMKQIVERVSTEQQDMNKWIISTLGEDEVRRLGEVPEGMKVGDHNRAWVKENAEEIRNIYSLLLTEKTGDPEVAKQVADSLKAIDLLNIGRKAYKQLNGETERTKEVVDQFATEKAIRAAVDEMAYENWLNELFAGAVKGKGIRNKTDLFTPNGNRRSFSATHWEVTLDNVVRAMRAEEKTGIGTLGRSIEGAAVKKYSSIKEVKADSGRLQTIDQDEYDAMRREFGYRFSEIAYEYANGEDEYDAGEVLVEYVTKKQTADGIYQLMQKDAAFYKPSKAVAEELAALVDEMKNAPTGYFEAKPRRAIGFEEMAAVIVPNNLSEDVKTQLENDGVNLIEYEAGNEADRLAKMNSDEVNHLRFSLRETDANIRSAVEAEEKAAMQVKAHRITAAEADKLAGVMLKAANSDYDRQEAASRIARTIDLLERGEDVDMRQVDDELTQLAADVMTHSRTLDLEHEEGAKPVRDYLRTTPIRLTESQRAEAASLSGSYGAYRKSLFGRVRLSSTTGVPLDTAWQELSQMDKEWFPANASEGDMAALLQAAVDESKPVYHNGMGMNVEESANWLAGEMMQAYFALPSVKAAAKDARTFGDSVRDLRKAMKTYQETSWSEFQNSLRAIQSARGNQQRTKQQEETAALRAKYQTWRDKDTRQRRENELKRKYRGKIESTANTMLNWLEKPTDAKHVPAAVEDSVRELLRTLDFTGKDTKVARELARRLEGIANSMENAQKDEEGAMYFEQDQQMIDQIRALAEKIALTTDRQQTEGRGIYDLNREELKDLDMWLGVVKHVLTGAGKLRGTGLADYNSLSEVQGLSVMELRQKTPLKNKHKALKAWEKYFGPDMMDSFTFFERMGQTATRVFEGLRSGFDENVRLLAVAEEHSKRLFEGVNLEELTGKNAPKHKVKLSDGAEVEMTKGEMMSIYVLSKREQARGHMYEEKGGEGIKLQSDEDPDPHVLNKVDERNITEILTDDERRIADGMQLFLSRECAGWGNATSMKLLGYRKFGEAYYWPIKTDSSTRNSSRLEQNFDADINGVIHQGMTKQTVEGARNAIVIEDAFDSYTRHISNMAAYSAYAIPMSDFNKYYGNTELKRAILKTMGPKGQEYIKNLIVAINGSRRGEDKTGVERAMAMLNRNAKAASVGANARVIVQQPTSYARAAAYMSPKYLSKGMTKQIPDDALIYRYCPIARWKDWGFRETNVGPNLKELLTGKKHGMAKMQDAAMKPAAAADMWTLRRLWNACELETQDLYGYQVGSDAYYQQVGKRMSELVDRTQVVDSVFHRSQMMRSKSWLAQTLTNFMSEPTKTFNMLVSATYAYAENRQNKGAKARLARIYGVWVATSMLTAASAALVDAFRDDEDEKKWLEKWASAFWDNTTESLNPLGMLPGVKEVLSIVQGYSPNRMDLQSMQRIMWAVDALKKYAQGEGTQNLYGVAYKMAQAVSSFSGVPLSNVMRDLNGLVQTATGTSLTLKESSTEKRRQRVGMIYDAIKEGNKAKAQEQREKLKKLGGATDKEIDTLLAEFLLDDPKVKEAWEAKASGRIADANRARNALTKEGFPGEAVDKAVQRYGSKNSPKETKEKDPDEQLNVKMYTSTDAKNTVNMILNGTATEADLREIMSELAADSTAKDPQSSVRSSVQSALKEEYIALLKKGDTSKASRMERILLSVVGTKQETIDKWKKEAKGK